MSVGCSRRGECEVVGRGGIVAMRGRLRVGREGGVGRSKGHWPV